MAEDASLERMISEGAIPPFVYTYPPRSAHRAPVDATSVAEIWAADYEVSTTRDVSLYLHVPFCGYKCGFCNLYTISTHSGDLRAGYVDALVSQLAQLAPEIRRRRLVTVYIGGGTPSVLDVGQLGVILGAIDEIDPGWRRRVEEVCIEATPDSVADNPELAQKLVNLGFTRVNMGVQSLSDTELKRAGRSRAGRDTVFAAVALLKEAGLPNLSVDLIMGFDDQTDASFAASVGDLIDCSPRPSAPTS